MALGNKLGRAYEGGKFNFIPTADLPANTIFRPTATSPFFGITEAPVKTGELSALAMFGTFRVAKPTGFALTAHAPVYATFTNGVGVISATGINIGQAAHIGAASADTSVDIIINGAVIPEVDG